MAQQENSGGYDIVIMLPPAADLAALRHEAKERLRLDDARIEKLMGVLAEKGAARIGSGVAADNASKIVDDWRAAGFRADMKLALGLVEKAANDEQGKQTCPACDRLMRPTPEGACPHCGIVLAKFDAKAMAEKRIREEERLRLQSRLDKESQQSAESLKKELEARLREEIRAELEKEMGLAPGKGAIMLGKLGMAGKIALSSALLVGAFFGGHWLGSPDGGNRLTPEQKSMLAQGVLMQVTGGQMPVNDPAQLEAFLLSPAGAAMAASDGVFAPAGMQADSRGWQLAEIYARQGQLAQANALLQSPKDVHDPAWVNSSLRAQAWVIANGGGEVAGLDLAPLGYLALPEDRVRLLGELAVILASGAKVAPADWRKLLEQADELGKGLPKGALPDGVLRAHLAHHAMARLQAASQFAARGLRSEVESLYAELDAKAVAWGAQDHLLLRQVLVELADLAGRTQNAAAQREAVAKLFTNQHWLGEIADVGRILSLPSPLWRGQFVSSLLAGMPAANPADPQLNLALAQSQAGLLAISGQEQLLQSQWPGIEAMLMPLPNGAQRVKSLENLRDALLSDFLHGQQQFVQRDKRLLLLQKRLAS